MVSWTIFPPLRTSPAFEMDMTGGWRCIVHRKLLCRSAAALLARASPPTPSCLSEDVCPRLLTAHCIRERRVTTRNWTMSRLRSKVNFCHEIQCNVLQSDELHISVVGEIVRHENLIIRHIVQNEPQSVQAPQGIIIRSHQVRKVATRQSVLQDPCRFSVPKVSRLVRLQLGV